MVTPHVVADSRTHLRTWVNARVGAEEDCALRFCAGGNEQVLTATHDPHITLTR